MKWPPLEGMDAPVPGWVLSVHGRTLFIDDETWQGIPDKECKDFMRDRVSSATRGYALRRVSALDGLEDVLLQYLPWSLATFPRSTPQSVTAHLEKEVTQELRPRPTAPEEIADVVMLAVHLASRAGVDLVQALRDKLAVIKARTWQEPNEHGFQEHVAEKSPESP